MKLTLAGKLKQTMQDLHSFYSVADACDFGTVLSWVETSPAQLVILSIQAAWSQLVQDHLSNGQPLDPVLKLILQLLDSLAEAVVGDLQPVTRKKCEHLITELVHQRDVTREMIACQVCTADDFNWLRQMRFYFASDAPDPLASVRVDMADASFRYGFEYLGVADRLVQTPLTDKCFLTLTQALHTQLGGSPFGPAGTGE